MRCLAELQEPAGSAGDAVAQLCAGAAGNETQNSWMEGFRGLIAQGFGALPLLGTDNN